MNKKHIDMTPICNKCGKTAPINEKMSTSNWTVYMIKEPCKCGGQFKAKFLLRKETATHGEALTRITKRLKSLIC